jgi:tetratricopeptide (TPR) repeat protein
MSLKNQAIQTALSGDWQAAITLNKNLIKENPEDIDALNRLALAYMIVGKAKEAKSTYQKVIRLDPLNPIAQRSLIKLKDSKTINANISYKINNHFLEQPGKTKVVELINIAPSQVIEHLRTGQLLELSVKRFKIFVLNDKQYIGVLPDDIGIRLIKFIKSNAVYEAFVKSANPHKVSIFIREVKKGGRFKDQPSFVTTAETSLFSGNKKSRQGKSSEDDTYLEEE